MQHIFGAFLLALTSLAHTPAPPTWTEPLTSTEFIYVQPGTFTQGDVTGHGRNNERPVHPVSVSGFYMGRYEVTVDQFRKFSEDTGYITSAQKRGWVLDIDVAMGTWSRQEGISWINPGFKQEGSHPVVWVDWNDANAYAKWLSSRTEGTFRLPTESEWEYAAKGGKTGSIWSGTSDEKNLPLYAWYDLNSKGTTHGAGLKNPNGWGIWDMSGNVWEWCQDGYTPYPVSQQTLQDPFVQQGELRVLRGGSWRVNSSIVTTTYRNGYKPGYSHSSIGFRLVKTVDP